MIGVVPQIPLGAVLLDGNGLVTVVEPDEHVVRAVGGHWVCVRPTHEGMACRVELAA
jgi:hypothetical protein